MLNNNLKEERKFINSLNTINKRESKLLTELKLINKRLDELKAKKIVLRKKYDENISYEPNEETKKAIESCEKGDNSTKYDSFESFQNQIKKELQ